MHGNIPNYLGNCVNILDTTDIFNDATELAQFIENSEPFQIENKSTILPKQFYKYVKNNPENYECGINGSIFWIYNINLDIHYFFSE